MIFDFVMLECESFQRSIDTVLDWAKKWQLKLSLMKCHYMRVSLRKFSTCATYLLSDALLNPVASFVCLLYTSDAADE